MANEVHLKDDEFQAIQELVFQHSGVNLTEAKRSLVVSRLSRRLRQLALASFDAYIRRLRESPEELETMVNLITTNVTHFFREKHHFDFLEEVALPEVLEEAESGDHPRRVKIWSAGCSTGEEPYSLAMTVNEFLQRQKGWDFRILASDINTDVLRVAQEGHYHRQQLRTVPYSWLKKYFLMGTGEKEGMFRVKDDLKKKLVFRSINLMRDEDYPRTQELDAIFCRNVFIYFRKETQEEILARFYRRLRPGGYLFLGHSETVNTRSERPGHWKLMRHTVYQRL